MTLTRAALLCPLVASLIACGDAGGTTPVGDGGAAQDGAAGAAAAWCARTPIASMRVVVCPATWPPPSGTRVPAVGCHAGTGLTTLEACIDPGIGWTPAQRALLASCDPTTFPPQPCAGSLAPDGGACVQTVVASDYVRAIALEVVRTGRCW